MLRTNNTDLKIEIYILNNTHDENRFNKKQTPMEKENEVYRFLHSNFERVVTERHMREFHNTTNIDISILDNIPIFIQVKHGQYVNTLDSLKKFNDDCIRIDANAVKIWYTQFPVNDVFREVLKFCNIHLCSTINDLYDLCLKYIKPSDDQPDIELRDYQQNAVDKAISNSDKSGIIIFPPGCGKTLTAQEIVYELWLKGFRKFVWTTRRKELLLSEFNDKVEYKKVPIFNMLTDPGKYINHTNNGLYIMNHEYFIASQINAEYIIVDECHESGASGIFKHLMKQKCPKLGLSATPYTGNQEHQNNVRKLFPNIFGELDPFTAIDKGYTMPLEFWFSDDTYRSISDAKNDICTSDGWFKCITWCNTIEECDAHGKELSERFPDLNVYVSHSKNDNTNGQMLRFKNDKINCILVCVNKAREGWNDPRINCVAYLEEVQNRAFHVSIQSGNRVNRIYDGKTRAIVIDCVNRDPVDTILRYYFSYNPQSLYKILSERNDLSVHDNSIYYKQTRIMTMTESFNNQFTINDVFSQIQSKIYSQTDFQKFIDQFQKYLWTFDADHLFRNIPASYDSYLTITRDQPNFMPNPVLEFGKISWAEVFGRDTKTILNWKDFKKYCVLNKPAGYGLREHYNKLIEKNSDLPENPADAYKQFRNYSDLFEIPRRRFG